MFLKCPLQAIRSDKDTYGAAPTDTIELGIPEASHKGFFASDALWPGEITDAFSGYRILTFSLPRSRQTRLKGVSRCRHDGIVLRLAFSLGQCVCSFLRTPRLSTVASLGRRTSRLDRNLRVTTVTVSEFQNLLKRRVWKKSITRTRQVQTRGFFSVCVNAQVHSTAGALE